MDADAMGTMEVAALGRPFSLGMLYDCRKDSLIPGMTLWDLNDLKNDIQERPQHYNNFEIVASESIADKSSALNVQASLKASFLGGLVEVGGSAKYLNDSKTSKNQSRVTLNYQATTKMKELSMNQLGRGNVKHPYVFDKGIATHVVTAILYGAQAFFVFDREVSDEESHQDIQGNLKVMIKKIPCLSIEGGGSLKMDDKDIEKVEKFSCKFHGDFLLKKSPTTFQDAVQVYQSLPQLLGTNGENAVPMKVWLMPLVSLDSKAAKLVRQISIRLVQKCQSVLEDFTELEMRCNDAIRTTTAQQFPQIGDKLKTLAEFCSEYKLEFQQNLAKILPSIRGGGKEEAVLAEILKKRHSSPFNNKSLKEWMDCKEREIYTLQSFTNKMKNIKIVPSQSHLYKETLNVEHAVCFVFTSLGSAEPYLSALSNYLKEKPKPDDPQDPRCHDIEKEQWYASKEVSDAMRHKAKLFSDFAEANKENKNIKFLTVGLTNETHKGSSIYVYEVGFTVSENFEPPSKPETVTAGDVTHNSVTLKIPPPRFGAENITSYCVEYCVSGEDGWKQTPAAKAEEVTVSGLTHNTEYMFRCRAVTSVGVGPAGEVSGHIKTFPCSPPGKPQVETNSGDVTHNSVTLKIPPPRFGAENITSYCVEYCVSGEDGWKQTAAAKAEEVTVSGLTPNTEYMFRCRAVTSVGVGPAGEVSGHIKTLPCSPPGKPQIETNSSEISVSSEKPAEIGQDVHILSYIVEYAQTEKEVKEEDLQWNQMVSRAEKGIISGLQSDTEYTVRVRCDCGEAGRSKESITVNVCTTKKLTDSVKKQSTLLPKTGPLPVYKIPLKEERINVPGCKRFSFRKESTKPNRTIMVLGATGAGKSTLINGMINYILGVKWKDAFRFKLIDEDQSKSQAHSQTSEITVYKINHQEGFNLEYSLTIVDTPGFGDTRGITRDREITEQLRNLFSAQSGVSEIDAICFVTQASLARLTATQKYVFDSVLSIFGKDVAENIRVLLTFADGQRPPVLEAINASGVPCPKTKDGLPVHFKFNNSALFADNNSSPANSSDEDDGFFNQMFWDMGTESMKRFFVAVNEIDTKTLTMTIEVLRERKQLENSIENLQKQVKVGLAKLEEIKETTEILKEHEAEISRYKDFEFEVTVTKAFQKDISGTGNYSTNCQQCHQTCHYPCPYGNDADKRRCVAMGSDGYCTVCPGKCCWSLHFNQKYKWEYMEYKEKRTVQELKEKYLKASEAKTPFQALIEKLQAEYHHVQEEVVKLMERSAKCLNRLREIALKPNPLSTPEYIDMVIEGEKSEGKPGWKLRVEALMDMRGKAELMAKMKVRQCECGRSSDLSTSSEPERGLR
ncbi:uncharacterized protein LOC128369826 [Scomber japonicus]|uniref:uncharacterized protein LOC128369826 n=1 Tax=Scomber japonicus TaxID=13676 RepID=UPI002304EB9C|nr:uncharacterized protein LOC128369826 [Scomber japonicus]